MNWKYYTGKLAHSAEARLIKLNSSFLRKNYPYGRNWMFDVKRIFNNAAVVIDAGANVGSVSLELNSWFPRAKVYAFEPIVSTYHQLVKNTAKYQQIIPFHSGLGSKAEQIKILLSGENTINSLKITERHDGIVGEEIINIIRVDEFVADQTISHIDILKIDVEGFEFEVLQGCGNLLTDRIKCIYLEVGYEREVTKVHFSDVEQYMEKNDFVLCGIYETRRNMYDKRRLWYSNNLYIKRELLN